MFDEQINRREALERVAWVMGGVLSAQLTAGLMGEVLHVGQRVSVDAETTELLAEIADVIIPATDTPGAKAAGAEQFVVRVMTTAGYFSSEIGATKALEYVPIPGRFEGAVPMKAGQKAWAI